MVRISDRDRDNLAAIMDYCEKIKNTYHRIEKSEDVFLQDVDFRDSMLMNIVQIGEAVNRLQDECIEDLNGIAWSKIVATRNIIVHGYIRIDYSLIWKVIEQDSPILEREVGKVLDGA